ncbi:hypothetical protein [Pseudomonas fluorescens]|uniref:hypothetical protein n=1 Tax=Pseudomonas fluorescens TaxID=294 RepID=UPI001BE64E32|nr:hypothetical protein [Pseudomonas fluorescens]MBT2373073.1 hypothetical protein [Pseudomonas fluorescens]
MGFATILWDWYGQGEYKRVLAVCEVFPALEFLAMSADEQREAIPDCPACEAWSMTILPLNDTLTACGNAMPSEVRRDLQNLWKRCNDISEDAFRCGDRLIFDHQDWQSIRESATDLLRLMERLEMTPYLDELTVDCHNEVNGYVTAKPKRS